MDSKIVHEFTLKQELNQECDRFFSFINEFSPFKTKQEYTYDCVILINGNIASSADPEWQSVIQTLKRYIFKINDHSMEKLSDIHEDITDQLTQF